MLRRAKSLLSSASPILATLALLAPPSPLTGAPLPPPRTVELWPGGAPGAKGDTREDRPAVTAYLPRPDEATGAGILVFPGGGFTRRCEDHEGVLVAEWLRSHGIAAFLVRYRVVPIGTVKEALEDGHRAIQTVRANAREFGVSPRRLGAVGFSAGAMLATGLALRPVAARPDDADAVRRVSSRPDFLVAAYGAVSAASPGLRGLSAHGLPPEEAANLFATTEAEVAAAPPTFFFGTSEDERLTRNMAELYARLVAARRPTEAHFFGFGEHGVGFAQGDPLLGRWPELLHGWLRTSGFLTEASRVALRGRVTIDGEPLPRGSVVLTPLADPGAPAVIAYAFGTAAGPGEFVLTAERGPTPGLYRVEVRQDATRWLSNSRDPVQQKMQAKLREGGTLTPDEVTAWVAAARAKDHSPSLDLQRVHRRLRPADRQDITVDVKAGVETRLDLDFVTP